MIDAQSSDFGSGSARVPRAVSGALAGHIRHHRQDADDSSREGRTPHLFAANGHGGRPQGPLKIKKPSPNAQKLLKVNKGQLRLFDTPGGVPPSRAQRPAPVTTNPFIFNHFVPHSIDKRDRFLPPKTGDL